MEPTKSQNEDFQEQAKNVSPHHFEGMRRDNESIDDFEHLEPESSPLKEFQGVGSQTKVDKHPILEPETAADNGASLVNPNTTDYSFLSASKLERPTGDKNIDQVGDGNFVSSSKTDTLLDSDTSLFGKNDFKSSELSEKTAFAQQPSSDVLLGLSSGSDTKSDVYQFFAVGEKVQSEFETDLNKIGNKKALTQAFMDTERENVLELPASHGDDLNKFMADIDYLKSEKETNEPDSDAHIRPADTISSLPQDNKQHDFLFDSDIVLEPSKSDMKLKGKTTDEFGSSKSSLSAHDDEFHDDISSSQDEKPEPEEKPAPTVEPEHKSFATILEPIKPFVPVFEPSSKPEPVPSSLPDIKPKQEKPSDKLVHPEISAKSKLVEDDNDLDEIKPIQLFQYMGLDAWFKPDRLHPKVVELVYWRDPKKSGIVFGSVLGVLLSLTYFSLISVVAYLSLALLTGTISFRIYKNVLQAVQKTSDGHPFKEILELDLTLPQDKVREVTDIAVAHVNAAALELRRLFLVEDLVDSIKFGVLLWSLTYVGSWFNGMTLIIIAFVALFTLPKVYENNKAQIDQNLDVVRSKIADITSKVKAAIPIGKKPVAEEDKKDQ